MFYKGEKLMSILELKDEDFHKLSKLAKLGTIQSIERIHETIHPNVNEFENIILDRIQVKLTTECGSDNNQQTTYVLGENGLQNIIISGKKLSPYDNEFFIYTACPIMTTHINNCFIDFMAKTQKRKFIKNQIQYRENSNLLYRKKLELLTKSIDEIEECLNICSHSAAVSISQFEEMEKDLSLEISKAQNLKAYLEFNNHYLEILKSTVNQNNNQL